MSFQPVVPMAGYAGWSFLTRTRETQQAAFEAAPRLSRDVAYFEEKIGEVRTAEDLVSDRRLLRVALGAFGLDDDINNRFFLRKVLEDGTLDRDALANRLSDKRYFEFSKAFGFGDFATPNTALSEFPRQITDAFKDRQFEIAVGDQNENLRLAMTLERDLTRIAESGTTPDGMWFSVMGQPPLRKVFETALGLPPSFGALDLDQQLTAFRDRARAVLGDGEVAQFADPAARDTLVRRFLVGAQVQSGPSGLSSGSTALALLQGAGGSGGLLSGLL